jgi:hypothetical protein
MSMTVATGRHLHRREGGLPGTIDTSRKPLLPHWTTREASWLVAIEDFRRRPSSAGSGGWSYPRSRTNVPGTPALSEQYLQMILDAHIATLLDGEGRSA